MAQIQRYRQIRGRTPIPPRAGRDQLLIWTPPLMSRVAIILMIAISFNRNPSPSLEVSLETPSMHFRMDISPSCTNLTGTKRFIIHFSSKAWMMCFVKGYRRRCLKPVSIKNGHGEKCCIHRSEISVFRSSGTSDRGR
jgi:hypothetical protein